MLSEKAFDYVVAGLKDAPYTAPYLLNFFGTASGLETN
jgi:hypothetical protein